jgi:hypothetical protein
MISEILFESVFETINISLIILVFMVVIEFIEVKFNDKLKKLFQKNNNLQITISSFFGIIPGCMGTFIIDSLYMSGIIGFGAINAVMISTFGDEAFAIIAMAAKPDSPISIKTVLMLFGLMFVMGIMGGYLATLYKKLFNLQLCKKCIIMHKEDHQHENKPGIKHFLYEHLWNHILKKHYFKLVLWLFFSIVIIQLLNSAFNLEQLITQNKIIILLLAAIIGILPISGPNLFFLSLFAQGMIPFSILLTNSIVQDGHGSLPLLSFSAEDTVKIKLFNIIFGLIVGFIFLFLGF